MKNSPLKGKNFIFLGSSVTKGFAAYGQSFADMIAARNDAHCVKEAVSGTTLAAVSYTHLDVYKRQAPGRPSG